MNLSDLISPQDPGSYVYHYTKNPTLSEILYRQKIRLGKYKNTNDPRENKDLRIQIKGQDSGTCQTEIEFFKRMADRYMREAVGLVCFSNDMQPSKDALSGAPFFRGWARARMWSQYADNHAGACLVFERSELCESIQNYIGFTEPTEDDPHILLPGNVQYRDHVAQVFIELDKLRNDPKKAIYEALVENVTELFFTKYRDWSTEEEFRLATVRATEKFPLDSPYGASLKAIVIGENFPECDAHILSERLHGRDSNSVSIFRCSWTNLEPNLTPYKRAPYSSDSP